MNKSKFKHLVKHHKLQIICRDKSNKRILNTIQFSVYGEPKVYFEDILAYNQPFMQAYQINREYTSLGKEFGMYLQNQDKYNIFYDHYVSSPNFGTTGKYEKFEDLLDEINNKINPLPEREIINEIKCSFENNKKSIIIINITITNDIYSLAALLNHEEGAHGRAILLNLNRNYLNEHIYYYGKKCFECGWTSPSNEDVENNKNFIDSRAKKNLDQIKSKIYGL